MFVTKREFKHLENQLDLLRQEIDLKEEMAKLGELYEDLEYMVWYCVDKVIISILTDTGWITCTSIDKVKVHLYDLENS